jgi:imidazole glycerol phosphate synthase subunit HisF
MDADAGVAHDGDLVEQTSSWLEIPVVSVGEDKTPADMAEALLMGADGVASASLFETGATTVSAAKRALKELGVTLRPPRPPYQVD